MHAVLNNLPLWDALPPKDREGLAREVERVLPEVRDVVSFSSGPGSYSVRPDGAGRRIRFSGVSTFASGDQRHAVAQYRLEGRTDRIFSLVAGGTVDLGWDRRSDRFPTAEQDRDWAREYERFNFP